MEINEDQQRTNVPVAYIFHPSYVRTCSRGTKIKHRASMVHSLIEAYGLTQLMKIVSPTPATAANLRLFHSAEYVDYLQRIDEVKDVEKATQDEEAQQFGFGYDCPIMSKQFEYVCEVVGGTLTAARCLTETGHRVAINWGGGWHHAKKDEAAGFCYVNDIVLGIVKLLEKFERVLYVDLDAHHGDGVQDAFEFTSKVMTVSFHKYEQGFYPGSGNVSDVGCGKGRFYSVNLPLKDGIRDENYFKLFSSVMSEVRARFPAEAVICQCGADGLVGDPTDCFNLTPNGLGRCVAHLLTWNLPIMFLGGGGYNLSNTARCWTHLTAIITGTTLQNDIPDNPFLMRYGPGYDLAITAGNRPDLNNEKYLAQLLLQTKEHLKNVSS